MWNSALRLSFSLRPATVEDADMPKPPLRPATPIDPELAEPSPADDTEIGKVNRLAERNSKPDSKDNANKTSK
jgi:hypothetical protein